jgi:hypothetical protein
MLFISSNKICLKNDCYDDMTISLFYLSAFSILLRLVESIVYEIRNSHGQDGDNSDFL